MTKKYLKALFIRAFKTFCETLGSLITVGLALNEINWIHAVSVSAVAFIYTVVINMGGLPEVEGEDDFRAD